MSLQKERVKLVTKIKEKDPARWGYLFQGEISKLSADWR
jgi:hypothetical protein